MSIKETLKIIFNKKAVKGEFRAISFKEGSYYIFYIPSLNLSSYGDTEEEAINMMRDYVVPDFCESIFKNPRPLVVKELGKMGWEKSKIFENELKKTAYIDTDGILRQFELDPSTKIEERPFELC